MTLFEAEAPVEALSERRTSHLPSPTKQRFTPLRAGVVNVWEYDEQQFWFADGRLLLRGRNEAGKSKALELLFPFVLCGDMSPKKLDPFDTVSKTMWWNMVGFDRENRKNPIGYLWLEFGRLHEGAAEYLTAIVGLQASTAERKVNAWFAVTPQRIDVDLDLQPGNLPLTQETFANALSSHGRFATKSSVHRANVASRLFSMSPERYENLLHLLRQLRKPKLADRLDRKKLSEVLTNALPPLDEARIEPLATGFGFLDDDINELAAKQAALDAAVAFLEVYRGYARTEARVRADAVRTAVTKFDDVTREENQNRRALTDAEKREEDLREEATQVGRRLAEASGSIQGLDLTAVETLNGLQQDALNKARTAEAYNSAATDAARRAEDAAGKADAARAEAEEDATALVAALAKARKDARAAGISQPWEHDEDHRISAQQLEQSIHQRRALVKAVRAANDRAATAQEKVRRAERSLEDAVTVLEEATGQVAADTAAADTSRRGFAADLERWVAAAPSHAPEVDVDALVDQLVPQLASGTRAVRQLTDDLSAEAVAAAKAAVEKALRDEALAKAELETAQQALSDHDQLPADPPPPRRAGIPETRAGAPLWFAVEFTDGFHADEAAMLEAALDAAGLLDAVLTERGLLDAGTDDTVLTADRAGHGLHDWLRPAEGADADLVHAVLSTIGAGADSGRPCWVDLDGNWANGQLSGRWTKAAAEHIGAGARAAARARRRLELEAAVTAAEARFDAAHNAVEDAERAAGAVAAWVREFPAVDIWRDAEAALGRAERALNKADGAHRRAHEELRLVQEQVAELLDAVEQAVSVARCRVEQVTDVLEALEEATSAFHGLRGAARDAVRSAEALAKAVATATSDAEKLAAATALWEAADRQAAAAKAKYETALRTSGADVEQILAEKDRLETEVRRLKEREDQVAEERREAAGTVAKAQADLRISGEKRQVASQEREEALAGLAHVVRTGHVALTVVIDADRDADDFLQPTAGRNLARQVAAAVPDADATPDARGRAAERLIAGFGRFRDAVTDFNPHLDQPDGVWVASATLNGELVDVAALHQALVEDVDERKKAIAAEERSLIEQHLRDEVGEHLGNCLHGATSHIRRMNKILHEHKSNSGSLVQLQWKVDDEAGPGVKDAVGALLTSTATRSGEASALLATFLTERVGLARRGEVDGADLTERLLAALDYRKWHTFGLTYKTSSGEGEFTSRTVGTGSGGQQAKISHQPLLAAAAGFYSTSPTAPRLCFLDEAFAGIDGPNTADLLRMSVTLDLDMVMTNFDAWFCIPELPGLAIYHLEKLPGTVGVAAIRYEWDGTQQQEHDPWLDE
jgi:uncharacterized protein (TIGR02680 family)